MIQLQNAQLVPARQNHSGPSVKKVLKKKNYCINPQSCRLFFNLHSKCVARHSWTIYSSDRPMATLHQTQIQAWSGLKSFWQQTIWAYLKVFDPLFHFRQSSLIANRKPPKKTSVLHQQKKPNPNNLPGVSFAPPESILISGDDSNSTHATNDSDPTRCLKQRNWNFGIGRKNDEKCIHSRKLTWNLKMMVSNRELLFQVSIFGCHVSFRGCTVCGFWLSGSGEWVWSTNHLWLLPRKHWNTTW